MNKVVLYTKAFGIVIKKRWKKRKEQKKAMLIKKQSAGDEKYNSVSRIALCVISVFTICASVFVFGRMADKIETLHIESGEVQTEMTMQDMTQHDVVSIKEVPASEVVKINEHDTTIDDGVVPLSAEPGDMEDISNWKHVDNVLAESSSVLKSESGKSYEPYNMLDGNRNTTWQEGLDGDGEGCELTFSFEDETNICGISIVNGNGISEETYEANNRPKDVRIIIGEEQIPYCFEDTFGSQVIKFDHAINTNQIKIVIDSIYKGSLYSDTCISKIDFYSE